MPNQVGIDPWLSSWTWALEKTGSARFEVAVDATAQVDTMPHEPIARAVKLQRLRVEKGDRDWAFAADGVAARAFKDRQIGKAIHT